MLGISLVALAEPDVDQIDGERGTERKRKIVRQRERDKGKDRERERERETERKRRKTKVREGNDKKGHGESEKCVF